MNAPVPAPARDELQNIPLWAIAPDPRQDRKHFDSEALTELAENIRTVGIVQPIVVRPPFVGEWDTMPPPGNLQAKVIIIAGERRWRAAEMAGLTEVPCIVKFGLTPADVIVVQAVENLQRKDLTLREQATLCSRLVNECGDLDAACARVNKSKAWVSLRATVLTMPTEIRNLVDTGVIRDVQIANSLAQLHELNAGRCQSLIKDFLSPDEDGEVPSRADVANQVRWERDAIKRREEAEARQAARAAADAEGEGEDDSDNDEPAETDSDEDAYHAKIEALDDELDAFAAESTQALMNALKLTPDPEHERHSPIKVASTFDRWEDHEEPLEDIETHKFHLRFAMNAAAFGRLADQVMPGGLALDVILEDLTHEQAQAIEKIVGKPLEFRADLSASGEHVRGLVNALTAPPVSHLTAEEYLAEWLRRHVTHKPGAPRLQAKYLHAAYAADCSAAALQPYELNSQTWGAAIKDAGIEKLRSGGVWYLNVELVR